MKQELTNNNYATLTYQQYYQLYKDCVAILRKKILKAKDIGIKNEKFKIATRSFITINHLIALKLYTDFTVIQREFKKNCRRMWKHGSDENSAERNSEIAHWCRYLKECCMFYGKTMKGDDVVYTGWNRKLEKRAHIF